MIEIGPSIHGLKVGFAEWNPSDECFRLLINSPAFSVSEEICPVGPDLGEFFRSLAIATSTWATPLEWSSYRAIKRFLEIRATCDPLGNVIIEFDLYYKIINGEVIWKISTKFKTEIGMLFEQFMPLAVEFGRRTAAR